MKGPSRQPRHGVAAAGAKAAVFTVNGPSRALCAVHPAHPTLHVFACAGVREGQPIHFLAYDDDLVSITSSAPSLSGAARHIWSLSSSAHAPRALLVTRSGKGQPASDAQVAIASFGIDYTDTAVTVSSVDETVVLPSHSSPISHASYASSDTVITMDNECARTWHVDRAMSAPTLDQGAVFGVLKGAQGGLRAGAVDPVVANQFLAASMFDVHVWDVRQPSSKEDAVRIQRAHPYPIRDLDVNPNRPHHIVTAGEDSSIRFWDLRRPDSPLLALQGHSHWVWTVNYNQLHDQLVLSTSSDCSVRLWNAQSVSSSPSSDNGMEGGETPNRLLETLAHHEDSVYAASWSSTDAWVFASLSYDGHAVINQVPQSEKYRILL
ncbi:WD domain, G-beta repeat [Plasmodiophora brassicae]|uniref:EIPR1-like beta-propeller domain-containing protein n=1 Tax=Plasmodiophora brassicae TaxID=37360 RepID=A0A0G4IT76_PLABS|nr:hypothetical protein PBRA_006463 [Plasmodiophora brassicae]